MKTIVTAAIAMLLAWVGATADAQTTRPAAVHDIPRIDGLMIDGRDDDWADRGFRVDVLVPGDGWQPDLERFDPMLRLAWDPRGLIVLARVRDDIASEAADAEELYRRDSVELFLATPDGGKDLWQAIITPGLDPLRPGPQTKLVDQRQTEALKAEPLQVQAVTTRTDDGYCFEALLPWNTLGISPEVGSTVAFRANVNDADATIGRSQMVWLEAAPGPWKQRMPLLKLADAPGEPITTGFSAYRSADGVLYAHWLALPSAAESSARISITQPPSLATAVEPRLRSLGRLEYTRQAFPAQVPEDVIIVASLGDRHIGEARFEGSETYRGELLHRLPLRFSASVFSGEHFPSFWIERQHDIAPRDGSADAQTSVHVTFYNADHEPVTVAAQPGRYGAVVEIRSAAGEVSTRYITLYRLPEEITWRELHIPAKLELPPAFGVDAAVLDRQERESADLFTSAFSNLMERRDDPAVFLAGLSETKAEAAPMTWRTNVWAINERWWYDLKKKTGRLTPYRRLLHLPPSVKAGSNEKVPLILFLHGSGERGDNVKKVARHGPPKYLESHPDFPAIVISPQCPLGEWWNVLQLRDLIEDALAKYPIDRDRIHLTGLSMGGFGSWRLAAFFPDYFASVIPICGGGDERDVAMLADIPVWVIHGARDEVVLPAQSDRMVAALREHGGRVRYTLDPDAAHDSWSVPYADDRLYEWLLAQSKQAPVQPRATVRGPAPDDAAPDDAGPDDTALKN